MADLGLRRKVSQWIREALEDRPQDRFLVTSRFAGYQQDVHLGGAFLEVSVQPLSDLQIADFVGRWFTQVERAVLPSDSARAAEKAGQLREGLLKRLARDDYRIQVRLIEMVANPLLLSVLCVVYRRNVTLPKRRDELYDECVKVLLHWRDDWRRNQNRPPIDEAVSRAVLKPLASWMHQEKDRAEALTTELAHQADQALRTLAKGSTTQDGATFLQEIVEETGLMVRPSPGCYSFLHLSFQEYLTACHSLDDPQAAVLADHFGDSWWQEVLLLTLGRAPLSYAREFFREGVASGKWVEHPALAELCLGETLHRPDEVFAEAIAEVDLSDEKLLALLRPFRTRAPRMVEGVWEKTRNHASKELRELALEMAMGAGIVEASTVSDLLEGVVGMEPTPGTLREHHGIPLVYIPGGSFLMGSKEGPYDDERPVHRVTLSPFWMGKYPVTNADYLRYLEESPGLPPPETWKQRERGGPEMPVTGVSWEDAQGYCQWAGVRLPTEAEWEYSCRGGTVTEYWSGDTEADLARVGWYNKNSGGQLQPVGKKPANRWGLHDMHGNVWEWCQDGYGPYSAEEQSDPSGPPPGSNRVRRGGSFWNGARVARSACRYGSEPRRRGDGIGFRVVLPSSPTF